jgi:protein LTV1
MAELAVTETSKMRENEGEAALYGITYDDSGYDYMQHLKQVGEDGAVDSVLLAAPRGSGVAPGMKNQGTKEKGKGKARDAEDMFQMPESALPSQWEMSVAEVHASSQAIPPELQGFQPDMDPHLRQVLEALDDDAFIGDDGQEAAADGDIFGELLGSGELDWEEEAEDFEFAEWGINDDGSYAKPQALGRDPDEDRNYEDEDEDDAKTENGEPAETWEDRFRAFKASGGRPAAPVSNGGWESDGADSAERSEAADTVASLSAGFKDMMVKGAKKRHGKRGPSDASGMSMSSASVYRSQGLRDLDDRFDRLEREYELDDDDEYIDDDYDDDVSIAPSYMSSVSQMSMFSKGGRAAAFEAGSPPPVDREDFEAIMDDFLENYEVVGNRMRESLGTTALSGADKLRVLRAALEDEEGVSGISHEENRRRILEIERTGRGKVPEDKDIMRMEVVQPEKEKWDVETILSESIKRHSGTCNRSCN